MWISKGGGKILSGRQNKSCSAKCRKKLRRKYYEKYYAEHKEIIRKSNLARFYLKHQSKQRFCQVCGMAIAVGKICDQCRLEQQKLGISISALKTRRFSGFTCEEDYSKAGKEKPAVLFTDHIQVVPPACEVIEVEGESHTRGLMRRLK